MDKKLAEEKVREMFDSLTPEQLAELQNSFAETMDRIKKESVEKLEALKVELEKLETKKKSIGSEYTNWDEKQKLNESINSISISILNQENVVKVLENNGLISNVTDQDGFEYKEVPDFRKVDSTQVVK
jgi:alpha-galactosidase/6-phospho-beta-glucosidase family protein